MSAEEPSKVTQIYDKLLALLAGALPCSVELQEPDDLDQNPPQQLAAGFGISFAEGENTDRCIDPCGYYQRRSFDLILTRSDEFVMGDTKTRTNNRKSLLEDTHKVIRALSGSHTLIGDVDPAGRTEVLSFDVEYVSDGGPVNSLVQGANYLFIELSVTAEYREPLNGGT